MKNEHITEYYIYIFIKHTIHGSDWYIVYKGTDLWNITFISDGCSNAIYKDVFMHTNTVKQPRRVTSVWTCRASHFVGIAMVQLVILREY